MGKLVIDCDKRIVGLSKIAQATYQELNQTDNLKAELVFMQAQEMQDLNRQTRGIDKVTDVLSYPTMDGIRGEVLKADQHKTDCDGKNLFIGSIVLCNQKIKEQAKEYGHSEQRERTYLIVHGLMHLFGYDHMNEQDKALMRQKEKSVLAVLGIEQ